MAKLPPSVVVDYGTDQVRVGLSGRLEPSLVLKNVIGCSETDPSGGELYFGKEAWLRRDSLSVWRHMERGKVLSWQDVEATLDHVFTTHLKTPSSEMGVLLSQFPMTTLPDRERMSMIMFECLDVPALFLASQSVLALLASGRVTGCVLDCGFDITHAVPVFQGHALPHAVRQLGLGGRDVTANLAQLLREGGARFQSATQEHDVVNKIKERMCYVSTDPSSEADTARDNAEADYQLPDGQVLRLGSERFRPPEILFSPHTVGVMTPGLPSLLVTSVLESDADLHTVLLQNPVLAGRGGLFPGMGHRLEMEATALAPQGSKVGPTHVGHSAWLGGSLMASLQLFRDMSVSAAEYQEYGPSVIRHKCF